MGTAQSMLTTLGIAAWLIARDQDSRRAVQDVSPPGRQALRRAPPEISADRKSSPVQHFTLMHSAGEDAWPASAEAAHRAGVSPVREAADMRPLGRQSDQRHCAHWC